MTTKVKKVIITSVSDDLKNIKKYGGIDIEPLINSSPIIYTALKEYIMKNGHFIFVDIESSDGNKVFIKV